jgi:hypothetical protein
MPSLPRIIAPLALVAIASACSAERRVETQTRNAAPPAESTGTTTVVDPSSLPAGHPTVPIADPVDNANRAGRAPRRLSVDQLRASLLAATGYTWVAQRTVPDPESPSGTALQRNADMLEALAGTLGRADFLNTTAHALDPAVTFSKLAGDAARVACAQSVADDADQPDAARRRILREVAPTVTAEADPMAVRRNVTYLARRFWGRALAADSAEASGLVRVFTVASTTAEVREGTRVTRPAGRPVDGWRAVCVALATDPQFLTY